MTIINMEHQLFPVGCDALELHWGSLVHFNREFSERSGLWGFQYEAALVVPAETGIVLFQYPINSCILFLVAE